METLTYRISGHSLSDAVVTVKRKKLNYGSPLTPLRLLQALVIKV